MMNGKIYEAIIGNMYPGFKSRFRTSLPALDMGRLVETKPTRVCDQHLSLEEGKSFLNYWVEGSPVYQIQIDQIRVTKSWS